MNIVKKEMGWRLYGADTLAGRYIADELKLSAAPGLHTAFICTDSDHEDDARGVSPEGLLRILAELEGERPEAVVYLSSHKVYGEDAGEGVDESRPTFGRSATGRAFLKAERTLTDWAARTGVTLTVCRAAWMFGEGMSGEMAALFNRAVRGHYVHVRGNDARLSMVTALDTARAMLAVAGKPGVFNISDGKSHSWLELVEAMTANAGARKRMTHLPAKWAKWIYRLLGALPIVRETLSPAALDPCSRTLTLDNSRIVRATGMEFHDTLRVIERADPTYPYKS